MLRLIQPVTSNILCQYESPGISSFMLIFSSLIVETHLLIVHAVNSLVRWGPGVGFVAHRDKTESESRFWQRNICLPSEISFVSRPGCMSACLPVRVPLGLEGCVSNRPSEQKNLQRWSGRIFVIKVTELGECLSVGCVQYCPKP